MPYLTYNLPIQRTGFRPYGHTSPWSATQLSAVGDSRGRPRQVFSEAGGRRLGMGQWQSAFSPWVLHAGGLHGLGGDPNCDVGMPYDVNGNACPPVLMTTGYNVPDVTPAPAGDCISAVSGQPIPCPGGTSAGSVSLPPGPAPRVPASGTLFPQTSPQTIYSTLPETAASAAPYGGIYATTEGCPSGYAINAQGKCAPSTLAQIGTYLPLIIGISAVALLLGGSRR